MELPAALAFFFPGIEIRTVAPLGRGNINLTLLIELADGATWVLQRLHPRVFADPELVMANVRLVTEHLQGKNDGTSRFFRLGCNPQGWDRFIDSEGCCWRLLTHIGGTRTLEYVENQAQAEAIGRLLGRFHGLTAAIDPERLADPLPGFHVTPRYLHHYDSLRDRIDPKSEQEQQCAEAIEQLRPLARVLEAARGALCHRVIHGDPKVANFLFAVDRNDAVSLIDLDTVKPGLLLHDLGDCLRSCCNPQGEGHEDPEAVVFVPELFIAVMTGYADQAGDLLGGADLELLVRSAAVISFELGLRFFTDHLAGNRYFRVQWPGQNLHRARIQLRLNQSILAQQETLERHLYALFSPI
jgi:hypothetical protein